MTHWKLTDRTLRARPPARCGDRQRHTGLDVRRRAIARRPSAPSRTGSRLADAGFDMLDVGAVAARSGPAVRPAMRPRACIPAIEGLAAGDRAADLRRHLLGRGRRASPGRRCGARSTTSAGRSTRSCSSSPPGAGAGFVLMHVEGRPRRGSGQPSVRRPDRAPEGMVRGAHRGRPRPRVSDEQLVIDPGLDFDIGVADGLEVLRRLGELRELGRPVYISLSRKDLLGAVLAGSWERRVRPEDREWATCAATARRRRPRRRDPSPARRERAAGDAGGGGDPRRRRAPPAVRGGSGWLAAAMVSGGAWEPTLAPGRERRTDSCGRARSRRRWRSSPTCPPDLDPGPRRGAGAHRRLIALFPSGRGLRDRPRPRADPDQRHRLREVAFVQPAGARRHRARAPSAAPSTSTRPRPSRRIRHASSASCARRTCARRSTTATRRARSGRRFAGARTSSSPIRTC